MNKYSRQNESLYVKPKRDNPKGKPCISYGCGFNKWITKEERLDEIKEKKYWRRLDLAVEIILNDREKFIWALRSSFDQRIDVYKQDVQERWDKRKNERFVRDLQRVTEHVQYEKKRRM